MNFANFPWMSYLVVVSFALVIVVCTGFYTVYSSWKNEEKEYIEIWNIAGQEINEDMLKKKKSKFYLDFYQSSFKVFPIFVLAILTLFFLVFSMPINNSDPLNVLIYSPASLAIFLTLGSFAFIPFFILFHYILKWMKKRYMVDMENLQKMIEKK